MKFPPCDRCHQTVWLLTDTKKYEDSRVDIYICRTGCKMPDGAPWQMRWSYKKTEDALQ